MTIWERAMSALSTLGLPVAESVLIPSSGEDYPEKFLVFFGLSAVGAEFGDNVERSRNREIQVSYYSRSGLVDLPTVVDVMEAAGFVLGPERELGYDNDTRHFGYAWDFTFYDERF